MPGARNRRSRGRPGPASAAAALPLPRTFGDVEVVHAFERQMPTGVAVADDGRIFVCYPRWGDDVPFTVAELRDGREVPYPDATINEFDDNNPAGTLAVAAGRHVYFTNNQLHLQDQYQGGEDLRTPPYSLMRVAIDAGPVR